MSFGLLIVWNIQSDERNKLSKSWVFLPDNLTIFSRAWNPCMVRLAIVWLNWKHGSTKKLSVKTPTCEERHPLLSTSSNLSPLSSAATLGSLLKKNRQRMTSYSHVERKIERDPRLSVGHRLLSLQSTRWPTSGQVPPAVLTCAHRPDASPTILQ